MRGALDVDAGRSVETISGGTLRFPHFAGGEMILPPSPSDLRRAHASRRMLRMRGALDADARRRERWGTRADDSSPRY
jgi:hypothetical protein